MKLLLTSAGLLSPPVAAQFLALLPKPAASCSVLLIAYGQTPIELDYIEASKRELINLGLTKITVFDLSAVKFETEKIFDAVYVCGGNTFDILNRMKKTGVFDFIRKMSADDCAVYVGVSAGSIIAGHSIEIAGFGSQGDPNNINLQDLSGLNLTNVAIYPHFTLGQQNDVDDFKRISPDPVIELTDQEALLVDSATNKTNKI